MTELLTLRLDCEDGTGGIFLDATDAQTANQLRFEIRQKNGGVGIWIFDRGRGRQLARALWRVCQEPTTVKTTKAPERQPPSKPDLTRHELTEESQRFPYVTWTPQKD